MVSISRRVNMENIEKVIHTSLQYIYITNLGVYLYQFKLKIFLVTSVNDIKNIWQKYCLRTNHYVCTFSILTKRYKETQWSSAKLPN